MASELTFSMSASYADSVGVTGAIEQATQSITLATAKLVHTIQDVGTSEEAIELGDVSSRGTLILKNLDATNYIEVKTATSGTIFAKLFPAGSVAGLSLCVVHLGSGAQSPFVIANSAACKMEIWLLAL